MVYDPYQPIGIIDNSSLKGEVEIGAVMPAFLLYAFDDMNSNANAMFAGEIAVDVLSTFVGGVGLLKNLRHLAKLSSITNATRISIGIKTIEFTSGMANVILHYTCDENDATCQQLQSFLRILEIATLGGDVLYGKIAKAKAEDLYANHFDEISDIELKKVVTEVNGVGSIWKTFLDDTFTLQKTAELK